MSRSERVFSGGFDNEYNPFIYTMLILCLIGMAFLMFKGVLAGTIYTIMILAGGFILLWTLLNVKGDSQLAGITRYIRIPFTQSLSLSLLMFWLGFAAPILLHSILRLFGNLFNVTTLAIPLFSTQINNYFITLGAAEVSSSYAWELFVTSFSAGTAETFVFSFAIPIAGILIGRFFFNLLTIKGADSWLFLSKKAFVISFAMLFAGLLFVGAHALNNTYSGGMFLVAFVFIMFSNISIYVLGVLLMFWIGYHVSNNQLAMILQNGFAKFVSEGLLSWYGAFLLVLFGLSVFYFLRNGKTLKQDWRRYWGS